MTQWGFFVLELQPHVDCERRHALTWGERLTSDVATRGSHTVRLAGYMSKLVASEVAWQTAWVITRDAGIVPTQHSGHAYVCETGRHVTLCEVMECAVGHKSRPSPRW